jgi:Plavaka transposase
LQIEQEPEYHPEDEFNYHELDHDENIDADLPIPPDNEELPNFNEGTDHFSKSDRAMIDLIKYCNKSGTSIRFFDEFMQILKRHVSVGFEITKAPTRSNFMKKLRSRITCPQAIPVLSPSSVLLPKFSMIEQIKDLLSTCYFQDINLCCVNTESTIRFHQYIASEEEGVGEVLGANWYRQTFNQKIGQNSIFIDPTSGSSFRNWLVPICIYNDKTGVGAMEGKYTLEPLMFTLAVIRRDSRQNEDAWRHMGFIPNYHVSLNEEDQEQDAEKSLALFHELLGVLLEDLVELQANPPCMTMNLFGEMVNIRLILEVAFVMGDQLSQDQHCCRKKSNSGGAGRVHHQCMTSYLSASNNVTKECYILNKKQSMSCFIS